MDTGRVRTDANSINALFQRAVALQGQRKFQEAEPLYHAVLDADANHIASLGNLGALLMECGKPREAAQYLERYLALRPHSADGYESLGTAYAELNRNEEAAALYAKALKFQNAQSWTLSAVVDLLLALHRPTEAIAILQEFRSRRPAQAAQALLFLASTYFYLGRLEEAQSAIDRAIALDPRNPMHFRTLSLIKTFAPGDPQIAAMESLSRAEIDAFDRLALLFSLAKAYTDIGEHERSFATQLEANRQVRAMLAYDEKKELAALAGLKAIFTPEVMAAKAGMGDAARAPVFILGMPRSGTTLVEQILATHPEVSSVGECRAFANAVMAMVPNFPADAADITISQLKEMARRYGTTVCSLVGEAGRAIDKYLANVTYAGVIQMAFPLACFIHVVRDPVDTCLSCFATLFAGNQPFAYDLAELGRYYRAHEDLMTHWHRVLAPGTIMTVRYEDLVADLKGQTQRMLAHCGLAWDDACLAFDKTERLVWTASAAQVRRPLYRSSVGRWRPAAETLKPLLDALG